MYEAFGADYDRFVEWPSRLEAEMPFLEQQLRAAGAREVLDVACGTGMHAIALASRGFLVDGTDSSPAMVRAARRNAEQSEADASFKVAAFGSQRSALKRRYDAVLCLGNSLPHVLTADGLDATLMDFRAVLRAGGLVLIQNRNFDAVLEQRNRWMDLQDHEEDGAQWLFVRFYDFDRDGLLTFNVVTLHRDEGSAWSQRVMSTRLWPIRRADVEAALLRAAFSHLTWYGDLSGRLYSATDSPNLVCVARC